MNINPEIIGWLSSFILLMTLSAQLYKQWHSKQAQGVSKWLFAGQVAAQLGFSIYSYMLGNSVFLFTNLVLLTVSTLGVVITYRIKTSRSG